MKRVSRDEQPRVAEHQGWPRRAEALSRASRLVPRASGRKERLRDSGLTRTLYYAHARVSARAPRSLRRSAALCRAHVSEQMMA